jgi:hypothetical protein
VDSGCVLSDVLAADTRRCGELVSTTADMMRNWYVSKFRP